KKFQSKALEFDKALAILRMKFSIEK
ncbi:TPA: hypothetical protein ACSCZ3_001289, partial [Campylobacter jejuni]